MPASTRPRRRWLHFSLRTILLVLTALCIWLGVNVDQARRQKEAVAAFVKLGASFAYVHQRSESPDHALFRPEKDLQVPRWLRDLAGDDFFQRAALVWFTRQRMTRISLICKLSRIWSTSAFLLAK